ncbi:MAG: ribosomal protein L7/L12 [Candidatus Shikimatogenerans sp. JK-2022]|nr:ribosomal protein L7/L12 [Candidatus Shikimatogenerans bostrichidophilus]
MNKLKEIAKKLIKLNIIEINELYEILNKKYNIKYNSINIDNNITNNSIGSNDRNGSLNIKDSTSTTTTYDLYLKSLGTVKLPVIKLINSITGKSLTESKKIIDNLPSLIKKSILLEDAKKIQEDFKKIDAEIELKESK